MGKLGICFYIVNLNYTLENLGIRIGFQASWFSS
jgi:hypothetical protein